AQFKALSRLRTVIVHSPEQLGAVANSDLVFQLVKSVDSLRSKVARHALAAMGELLNARGEQLQAQTGLHLPAGALTQQLPQFSRNQSNHYKLAALCLGEQLIGRREELTEEQMGRVTALMQEGLGEGGLELRKKAKEMLGQMELPVIKQRRVIG
ncbi:unnamed protein product, partial [Arctogadus glacialis]